MWQYENIMKVMLQFLAYVQSAWEEDNDFSDEDGDSMLLWNDGTVVPIIQPKQDQRTVG
jgi:hypothetical protein